MKHLFLMCPPEYFTVAYIINPWMHGNLRKIDNVVAKQQWRSLYDVLCDRATVRLVLPQPGSPDMVFTANAGLVKGRDFIVSRFRYPERQYEEPYFADWFMDRGYQVSLMPRDVPFEGAGDALFDRSSEVLWMAHGHRSISAAREVVQERLGVDVVTLKLVDQRFYHLDTCFCPLAPGVALYHPEAFDTYGRRVLHTHVPTLIPVIESEAHRFGCNAIVVGKTVVHNSRCPQLATDLHLHGYRSIEVELDEFLKAGGSAKCLTLRLDGEEAAGWKSRIGT